MEKISKKKYLKAKWELGLYFFVSDCSFLFFAFTFQSVFFNVGFNKNRNLIRAVTVGLITTTSTVEFFR